MRWKRVKWTQARQLTGLLGWEPDALALGEAAPDAYFDHLRQAGRLDAAVKFLGQALPRFEAVAWATRSVRELTPVPPAPADMQALKSAFLWLQDPNETRRRAAFAAVSERDDASPERFCALAAYFSGGSLAPETAPPVPAPKEATGRLAAGAVLLAAGRSGRRSESLEAALKLGDAMASGSVGALA